MNTATMTHGEMKILELGFDEEIPENYTGIILWKYGSKEWYQNGLTHREDGPAVEWDDGAKFWYLNDIQFSKEQWEKEVNKLK
jgi:hypothetical protein